MLTMFFLLIPLFWFDQQTKIGDNLSSTIYLIDSHKDLCNRGVTPCLSKMLLFLLSDNEDKLS